MADTYSVFYQGSAHTYMDTLCHKFNEGRRYKGFEPNIATGRRAERLAIECVKQGIFTRVILMDIARLKGVPYLEPKTPVYAANLEAWGSRLPSRPAPATLS